MANRRLQSLLEGNKQGVTLRYEPPASRNLCFFVLLLESLSSFSVIAYSSGYMKQYTLSQTYGLRFVIILLPAALLKRFPCKSCAMYAASRSKAIRKLSQRRCTLQGRQGKEDTEDISEDHYLAGFRHKYYTLVGRCFQTFSFFLHSIFDGFLFFFFPCWCGLYVGPWKCCENCVYFLLVSLYPALPFPPFTQAVPGRQTDSNRVWWPNREIIIICRQTPSADSTTTKVVS